MQPLGENASNIPAFLGKLWKMVNDPSTDHLICWSSLGNSFIISNEAQFWYELLPIYYKHNNMSSFVRQLNMYGFHKMSSVENGSMDAEKDEIQFYHKYFQKDQPELLNNIKRKVTMPKTSENIPNSVKSDDISEVLSDVKQLRGKQSSVDSQLSAMKQENALLWREFAMLRQKHMKQQQIVSKLIQFLVTLVQPSSNSRMGVGLKRRMPLMLDEIPIKKPNTKGASNSGTNYSHGPTIHELDNELEISTEELLDSEIEPDETETKQNIATDQPISSTLNDINRAATGGGQNLLGDDFWDRPEFVLLNNEGQSFELPPIQDDEGKDDESAANAMRGDPMISGTESVNYDTASLIDFSELLDDSFDTADAVDEVPESNVSSTVNTPLVVKAEPVFPSLGKGL